MSLGRAGRGRIVGPGWVYGLTFKISAGSTLAGHSLGVLEIKGNRYQGSAFDVA